MTGNICSVLIKFDNNLTKFYIVRDSWLCYAHVVG